MGLGIGVQAARAQLIDLSVRGPAPLTAGFSLAGAAEPILVRGIGPTLGEFGVGGALPAATLELFDSNQTVIAANSGWDAALAAVFAQVSAFPLPIGSADAALAQPLVPGTYTARVSGSDGIALAEVYDVNAGSGSGQILNLSALAPTAPGAAILTGGFIIGGTGPQTVLIRGIGPSLAAFGIPHAALRATLSLYDANQNLLATNAYWGGGADLAAIFAATQAFALPPGSDDAALVVTLPPGGYSAQLAGSGSALVELYAVPPSASPARKFPPGHYQMLPIGSSSATQRALIAQNVPDAALVGCQICYTWAELEGAAAGDYGPLDASVGGDLDYLAALDKQLVVQLQYKSRNLADFPAYLRAWPNALVQGPDGYYIPNFWDPAAGVLDRFLSLLRRVATRYDAHPALESVNLAESATVDSTATLGGGYTAQGWVNGLQTIAVAASQDFSRTTFEEYINHITGDDALVGTACANAINAGISIGGPDIDPSRNNIPAYAAYAPNALTHHLGSAVQPMDYLEDGAFWYDSDHSQTTEHLFAFATGPRLHVDYIFWTDNNNNSDWKNAKATIDAHPWPWY